MQRNSTKNHCNKSIELDSRRKKQQQQYAAVAKVPSVKPALLTDFGEIFRWVETLVTQATKTHRTEAYAWGFGIDGCLGINNTSDKRVPTAVHSLRSFNIQAISAGVRMSLFLSDEGLVYQSGRVMSQVGVKTWRASPVKGIEGKIFGQVSAGLESSFIVTEDGREVYSWGTGINGYLGYETTEDVAIPRRVEALDSFNIVQISTGMHYTMALTSCGKVFSWGKGLDGRLAHGNLEAVSIPKIIDALQPYFVLYISAGEAHGLAIADGSSAGSGVQRCLFGWGRGLNGCLGIGSTENRLEPTEVGFFRGHQVEKVSAGSDHSLVLCRSGVRTYVYSFGGNHYGQLGVGNFDSISLLPVYLKELDRIRITAIEAASLYSLALTENGELLSWGDGAYSRTCQDLDRATIAPWKIEKLADRFVSGISAGKYHVLALLRDAYAVGKEELDRRRRYSIPGPVPNVSSKHVFHTGTTCFCKDTGVVSSALFSLYYMCSTCNNGPLCRKCCRRCHVTHDLYLKYIYEDQMQDCQCSDTKEGWKSSCKYSSVSCDSILVGEEEDEGGELTRNA